LIKIPADQGADNQFRTKEQAPGTAYSTTSPSDACTVSVIIVSTPIDNSHTSVHLKVQSRNGFKYLPNMAAFLQRAQNRLTMSNVL